MNTEQVTAAIDTLKLKGKLHVKAVAEGELSAVEFWILCKSHNGGFPYGYAASDNGETPSKKYHPFDKYRILSGSELYNWLAHLETIES